MRDFLSEGMKVKVTMILRGRENAHPEFGNKMMGKIMEIDGSWSARSDPKLMGRSITMMISPFRGAGKGEQRASEPSED